MQFGTVLFVRTDSGKLVVLVLIVFRTRLDIEPIEATCSMVFNAKIFAALVNFNLDSCTGSTFSRVRLEVLKKLVNSIFLSSYVKNRHFYV